MGFLVSSRMRGVEGLEEVEKDCDKAAKRLRIGPVA